MRGRGGGRPDEKWGADISYVWTREGWLYLAVVIDLFARRVVGWAVGDRLHRNLALASLRKALTMRRPSKGLIHHSDLGSQYCSIDYQSELRRSGILISMSGKGNCYDYAMVETFFKTLKSELVWRTTFLTRSDAERAIAVQSCPPTLGTRLPEPRPIRKKGRRLTNASPIKRSKSILVVCAGASAPPVARSAGHAWRSRTTLRRPSNDAAHRRNLGRLRPHDAAGP